MSPIFCQILTKAVSAVQTMDLKTKEQLADEIFRTQPNMMASVVVLDRFGVSMEKINFPLNILIVCFTAMKVSGQMWPLITEDEQDLQLQRLTTQINFSSDFKEFLLTSSTNQYIESHAEQVLLSYVSTEKKWLEQVIPEESDKFVFFMHM